MFYSNFKCSVFQNQHLWNCLTVYSIKSMHSIQFLYTIWSKTYLHPPTSFLVLPPKLKTMAVTFSGRCGFLVYVPAIKTIISFNMDYHCDVKVQPLSLVWHVNCILDYPVVFYSLYGFLKPQYYYFFFFFWEPMRLKVSTYRNSSSLGVGPLATFQKI